MALGAMLVVTSAGVGALAQREVAFTGTQPKIVHEPGRVDTETTPPASRCAPKSGARIVLVDAHVPARRCADPVVLD